MHDLQNTLNLILDYVKGIWIKKRYVIICSWLICPAGFFYVAKMPDVYESKAVVFVDTRSVLQPLLRGLTIQSNPAAEVQQLTRTLLSRENIEKIARETDLDLTTSSEAQFEGLVTSLKGRIKLRGTGRNNIYTFSFADGNPETAQRVVQETLNVFVESALGKNRKGTDTADRFINDEIAEYETQLAEAEQRLADFKRQYSSILPVQGTFYQNLSRMNQSLEATQLEISQLEQQIASMKKQQVKSSRSDGLGVINDDNGAVLRTRYDDRILALEERIDALLLRFTTKHPDVVEANTLLESLEAARKKEIEAFLATPDSEDSNAPLSELNRQLKLQASLLEGQLASLKVKENSIKSKIGNLESKIDLIPQIEAESTALNRDYGIKKNKYEQLLARRESADLSRRADSSSEDLQFRIMEPAMVPTKPSGPQRFMLYTGMLALGFGVGIAIAFLISQLKPILLRSSQLSLISDYPVWGVVTHLEKAKIKRQERLRMLVFLISSGAVVSMYCVLVVAESMNINLLQRFIL